MARQSGDWREYTAARYSIPIGMGYQKIKIIVEFIGFMQENNDFNNNE